MKKHTIIFVLFITAMNAKALETKDNKDTASIVKQIKNEIGVNVIPILNPLIFASTSNVNRFSVSYKRILNDKSALRFALELDLSDNSIYTHSNSSDTILQGTDNSLIKQHETYSNYFRPHFNLGFERYFGKRKLEWFYGADAVFSYYENIYKKQNINLDKDSTSGSVKWVENNLLTETVLSNKSTVIGFGISPFLGAKYSLSKKFAISVQAGADISIQMVNETEINKNHDIKKSRFTTFDFDESTGLINNISIIYKF